jgi:hypothetical protein
MTTATTLIAPRRGTLPISTLTPLWMTAAQADADAEANLRQALVGRYDTHARTVLRALTEENELRAGDPPTETTPGLVAVHAYHAAERDDVDRMLRGLDPPDRDAPAAVVARCVLDGLRQLPVVFGPVFAACATHIPLDAYLCGGELTEPGFVAADLAATDHVDAGLEYVIWSVSARRVGPVAPGEPATALFAAGSRFAVLGVDTGSAVPRVVLLDLAAQSRVTGGSTEDLVRRLVGAAGNGVRRTRESLTARGRPIGVDDSGRAFQAAPIPEDPHGGPH